MTVTPEMIERVAKAICASEGFEPDEECLPGTPHFVAYFPQAQAAIEAMSQASPPPQDEVGRALEMLDRRRSDAAASGGICEIAIEEIDELRAALTAMKGTGDE